MIQRKFRLPASVRFVSPFVVSEKEFLLKAQKNNTTHNRFGFVVGKSVDKRATARNELKRSFRSFVEKHWLEKPGNYDVLFVLRPACRLTTPLELSAKINLVLKKAIE